MKPAGLTHRTRHPGAFTLLELLAVVAIIGLLAALIIPVFGRTIEKSKAIKCAAQLHQLGVATAAYQGEHNGEFPAAVGGYYPLDWGGVWYSPVVPQKPNGLGLAAYTDGPAELYKLSVCPLNHNNAVSPPCVNPVGYPYVVNYYVMASLPKTICRNVQIAQPSKMIVMMDSVSGSLWGLGVTGNLDAQGGYRIRESHSGKANILWADGHVSSLSRAEIRYDNLYRPDSVPPSP